MQSVDLSRDPAIGALVREVQGRFGDAVLGVVVYGSYLRGKRDTLIDLYVLLSGYTGAVPAWQAAAGRVLAPNVYHLRVKEADVRSKCTVMRLDQLERAVLTDFHPYFWARFCQPFVIAYTRDENARRRIEQIRATAAATFLSRVGLRATSRDTWIAGFRRTYACEVRPESPAAAVGLYQANADYFDAMFESTPAPGAAASAWPLRAAVGKLFSVLRIVKAGLTFEDPLDYVVWKTARHSGVHVTPTERQRRHPLIFGWGVIWRLYRRGAFR